MRPVDGKHDKRNVADIRNIGGGAVVRIARATAASMQVFEISADAGKVLLSDAFEFDGRLGLIRLCFAKLFWLEVAVSNHDVRHSGKFDPLLERYPDGRSIGAEHDRALAKPGTIEPETAMGNPREGKDRIVSTRDDLNNRFAVQRCEVPTWRTT